MKLTKWLLFATTAVLPLYVIRCSSFIFCAETSPIPFTFLEVLISLTVLSWLVWKYKEMKSGTDSLYRLSQRLRSPLLVFLLAFLGASLVSTFVASDIRGALGIFKAYFLEGFLLYLVAYDFLLQTKQSRFLMTGLIASGLWLAGVSIYEWVYQVNVFAPQELLRDRVSGVYTTSNALGLFQVPIFILGVSFLSQEIFQKNYKAALGYFFASLLILFSIFASGSRGSFLALSLTSLFSITYLVFHFLKKETLFRYVVSASVLLILLGQVVFFANIDRYVPERVNNSIDSRLCLWQGTRNLLVDKPLIGSGLNGFRNTYSTYQTCSGERLQYPHNLILNFWTETGIVGLISFLGIIFILVWRMLKPLGQKILKIGLVGVLVGVLGHGLVDVPFFKNDLAGQFWILVAYGSYLTMEKPQKIQKQ